MSVVMDPFELYRSRIKELKEDEAGLSRKQSLYGWLRLIIIVLTFIVAFQVFNTAGAWAWLALGVGIALFLLIITIDANSNAKLQRVRKLIQINEAEIRSLDNDFNDNYDGAEFIPPTHYYAGDLDVFGKFSLYQLINRCYSEQGRKLLADNFLSPLYVEDINKRHEAIRELSRDYHWRQNLQAIAADTPITIKTENRLKAWLQLKNEYFVHPAWKIVAPLYCIITVSTLIATIFGFIPTGIFSFLFIIFLIISTALSKNPTKAYMHLSGITNEVGTIQQIIHWIEKESYSSPLFNEIKAEVKVDGENAGEQIKKLKDILNRFDLRLNVFVFIFLNSFLLWDVWQMIALNRWKEKNKQSAQKWFSMIAQFEVLNSLATLHFNKPSWILPKFNDNYFTIKGSNVGHPLIKDEQRVDNSFELEGRGKIALITGSNMAGKSTFLRSLGSNVILAQMGAPVCALSFELSPVSLISSMRIADNLAENTSTFYAELKKLQTVIEAVKRGEPVFILLDEILRGTNSLDRHIGSKALIRQLIKEKAVAVIATHDVELAKLSEDYGDSVENYHFDVQVANDDELYFDYKLKEGVCTSLNASILMRKIGIELEEGG